jgi:G8 domain-containing protein
VIRPLLLVLLAALPAAAQTHEHTPATSGVPQGIPLFCASPSVTSTASGAWSNPAIWSTRRVPAAGDRIRISVGDNVVYDVVSDARLDCIEVDGRLSFAADRNTRLKVANLTVIDAASLEVGTEQTPIASTVTAEIVIADQRIDGATDPAQIGTGIQGLGRIRMHGAIKRPTFVRVAEEPLAGQTTIVLDEAPQGWAAGDEIVMPDTRQLPDRSLAQPNQIERLRVAAIEGTRVTVDAPLRFAHKGARTPDGKLQFLSHIGNITRNIVIRSENPSGTRGHTIFTSRADVDMRYVAVREMGRTVMGPLDNTEFDSAGNVVQLGVNQIGRYAIHFHHDFGPVMTPANGYQFTLIGDVVDDAPKWGITIHNSHHGLVRDNVVYNAAGAGIVTEDGNEAFNVFDHNFALRVKGSGEFAPRSGYAGTAPDPGGEGNGFWFRGPDNYIRNNVAADADAVGFGLAAGGLGTVRVPAFKGADPHIDAQASHVDTTLAPVLEFTNNEAYAGMVTGATWGWNGTVANFRVWHTSRQAFTATPTDTLTLDHVTLVGDASIMNPGAADRFGLGVWQNPVGIWISNYMAKGVVVKDANIQGMRAGIVSPFYAVRTLLEPGRGDGSVTVENGYFRNYVGVAISTGYAAEGESPFAVKHAAVKNVTFAPLDVPASPVNAAGAISMNYGVSGGDREKRDPIVISGFNGKAGDDFTVYYSLDAPPDVAPCHGTRPEVQGWVCK